MKPRLTADLRRSRAKGGKATNPQEGNKRLREMPTMRARALCRTELANDPKAKQRYDTWASDFEERLKHLQRISFEKGRQR